MDMEEEAAQHAMDTGSIGNQLCCGLTGNMYCHLWPRLEHTTQGFVMYALPILWTLAAWSLNLHPHATFRNLCCVPQH